MGLDDHMVNVLKSFILSEIENPSRAFEQRNDII